jgi:hypothetical protein
MSSKTFPLNSTGSTDEYETDDYSPSPQASHARGRDPPSEVSGGDCGSSEVSKCANGRQRRTTPHSSTSTAALNRNARSSGNRNNDGGKRNHGKKNPLPPQNPARALRISGRRGMRGRPNSENDLLSGSGDDDDDDDPEEVDNADDDDSDTDDDPFANLSRFQGNKRRKLPCENSSASHSSDDDDYLDRDDSDCSSSYSSSDEYTTKKKNAPRSFSSAKALKKTESAIKSSSAEGKPACSSNSNSHLGSDGSVSSVELVGPAPRKNPVRITRTSSKTQTVAASTISTGKSSSNALVEKNSMADKRKSTDCGLIELLSDDDDVICGTFSRSPGKQTLGAASAVVAATTVQKKKGKEHDPLVRAESQAALEKGRRARDRLKAAQQYKAKEVGLPPPSPPPAASLYPTSCQNAAPVEQTATAVNQTATAAKQPAAAANVSYTGPTIQLTLQYSHPMTNKNSKSKIKIKMDQPLQHIMDKQLNVGNSVLRITNLTFDGEKVNMTKTPNFYDMEDSDLVDVVVMVVRA